MRPIKDVHQEWINLSVQTTAYIKTFGFPRKKAMVGFHTNYVFRPQHKKITHSLKKKKENNTSIHLYNYISILAGMLKMFL